MKQIVLITMIIFSIAAPIVAQDDWDKNFGDEGDTSEEQKKPKPKKSSKRSKRIGHKKSFNNATFHIALMGGLGVPFGHIPNTETNAYSLTYSYSDGTSHTFTPTHFDAQYGLNLEYFPLSKGGFKLGIRGKVTSYNVIQSLSSAPSGYESPPTYNEVLLNFFVAGGGLSLYFEMPSLKGNYFNLFITAGGAFYGKINYFPIATARGVVYSSSSSLEVFNLDAGIAWVVAVNHVTIGAGIAYSYNLITLKNNGYNTLYVPDENVLHDIIFRLTFGVYF